MAIPHILSSPTKLEKQIQDIEDEYSDRISSVRADDSLTVMKEGSKFVN
jgi:hypothetical protein